MAASKEVQNLIRRIALDDHQASFKTLYLAYYDQLFRLSFLFLKSQELAEEIVDDVMLNIWENRANLLSINNLTVYLYVAVKNRSLRYLSNSRKIIFQSQDELDIDIPDLTPSAEDRLIAAELWQTINQVISSLSPQCKLIFKLVKEDGLRYKEVAEILNISTKNVEYHIGNALKQISRHLPSSQRAHINGNFKNIFSN